MASRSCGTCRDRRILCDRTVPTCSQCSQSNRTCKGYGLRLSWPKANDKRRAMVARSSLQHRSARPRFSNAHLVNTSTWDIEMHRYLFGLVSSGNAFQEYHRLTLQSPMPFNPFKFDVTENCLFQYFQSTASCSLTTFGHDPTNVGNILIRMALVNNSPSTAAVLRSLLALSSLHRSGLQSQAAELKIAALNALSVASNREISAMETIQHVAAGMLLCSYEIYQASCTSGQWRSYIIGVKSVIKASSLDTFKRDSDFNALLDWVYYHDVLSRFSLTHWHPPEIDRLLVDLDEPVGTLLLPVNTDPCMEITHSTQSPFIKILKSFIEVCNLVPTNLTHMSPSEEADNFKSYLKILAWKIRSISISDTIVDENPRMAALVELFQLATLVYLNRAFGNTLESAAETQQRVERAFSIFSELSSCERQYPLFILGCEARTDAERCIVMDLISRTEKGDSSRSLFITKKLIQAIWVQDDLSQGEIDYTGKLSAIMSCCTILPTFV
ncbi:hypothetical protein PENSOL_c001G05336 [Penicillium solitum]|uniref:Zn(2)-C6 fungal-type domain-containing protein n=1 Tax=Penicillium solitum TaxID=60172 RepID=A0A1V6RNI5_9EURO|nr:uncharacterized protein PENSOL_c001G05336 [Penicillium solitum]OQE03170.1 hypothetical protein PENSOL_c001G05336 [Penicillium solitum]